MPVTHSRIAKALPLVGKARARFLPSTARPIKREINSAVGQGVDLPHWGRLLHSGDVP